MKDYTDKQNDPTKYNWKFIEGDFILMEFIWKHNRKSFFTSVKTLLDSKMAQVDKKLKRLG